MAWQGLDRMGGEVSMSLWDTISTYIVEKYFKQPNYWLIDGKPYFSIYEIVTFINGLGGMEQAEKAIRLLDEKTRTAGFPGVHLNVMSWNDFITAYPDVLYTPNVSMGWDASPRCTQTDKFEARDYPWTPVFTGNTPAAFQQQLMEARMFLDKYKPRHKIVVLNSWNEWTEGSYLLPEKKFGDAYLKAIKAVFGGN